MSDCACVDMDLVASLEDLKERAGESKNQLEFCKRRPPVKEEDEGGTRLYNVGVIRKSFPTQKIVFSPKVHHCGLQQVRRRDLQL